MMRLGFQTAYLDESAVIDHYAEQYVTTMHDKGIDASYRIVLQFKMRVFGLIKNRMRWCQY